MKRSLFLLVLSLVCFLHTFAQSQNIEIQACDGKNILPLTFIDSITYDFDGTSFNQIIWNKSREYKTNVNDVNQFSFHSEDITYNTFDAKEYGIENGIINNLGQYAVIGKDTISNNGAVIIIGDINKDEPEITVQVDSFKLVRHVYCESIIYRYFYGEDDFTVLALNENGDSLNCETFTYNQLQEFRANARGRKKVGGTIYNSGWYNLFSLIDLGIGTATLNSKNFQPSLLTNYASMSHNPYISFAGDAVTILKGNWFQKALILLKWLENTFNFFVFRGASITTLPHEEISNYSIRLNCQITGLNNIPRIRNNKAYAVCSMKLRARSGASGANPSQYMNWDIEERNVNSDGNQSFDYFNLLPESQYEYYPQLNLAWTESNASIWVKLSDDVIPDIEDWTVITEEHRSFQSVRGEQGGFFTSKPIVKTGDPDEVKVLEATVKCSFSNIPNDASCGVECTGGGKTYLVIADDDSIKNGETYVTIEGLKPGTFYTYRAYVDTEYKEYNGRRRSFTTLSPYCSTGDVVSKTDKSAIVKCSYNNVSEGIKCGVMVSSDYETKSYTISSTDGEQPINLTGLTPGTTYNYWAYVEVDGIPDNGKIKSFTTDFPDLSGTWTFNQSYFAENTLQVNLIYEYSNDVSVTYKAAPGFFGVNTLSVTFNANRTIEISCGGPADFRGFFHGTINENFTFGHGDRYQYATPNTAWYEEKPWTFSR